MEESGVIEWKEMAKGLYKDADPGKVFDEIQSIGESASPEQIVELAKDPGTELHKCFTWDVNEAARKQWLQEARHVVSCLVIKVEKPNRPPVQYRILEQSSRREYKRIDIIVHNKDEYSYLLSRARVELEGIRRRYERISELEEVMEAIDEFMEGYA